MDESIAAGIAPWEVVPSAPDVLHLRHHEGGGWILLVGMLVWASWGLRRAVKGERRLRTARLVASAGIALAGVFCAWLAVWETDVVLGPDGVRWQESRLPGYLSRQGELRAGDLSEVAVGSFRTRTSTWYRVVLLAKDGTERVPDDRGSERALAEALAARMRAHLAARR